MMVLLCCDQVPVVEGVSWDVLENQLESFPQVILADLVHQQER